jgi:hypothetical protein
MNKFDIVKQIAHLETNEVSGAQMTIVDAISHLDHLISLSKNNRLQLLTLIHKRAKLKKLL